MKIYAYILGLFLFSTASSVYSMEKDRNNSTLRLFFEEKQKDHETIFINQQLAENADKEIVQFIIDYTNKRMYRVKINNNNEFFMPFIGTVFMFVSGITLKTCFKNKI